ncbi:hypothetical protein CJF32_00010847 [Rutstroemia sp. NJR-2017a WRK4]|nr:hypothetical protein CJF32_00010847 [Rutstroemia sp. NJR-2017a WRK4]
MERHPKHISTDNQELCRKLLKSPQSLPKKYTLRRRPLRAYFGINSRQE